MQGNSTGQFSQTNHTRQFHSPIKISDKNASTKTINTTILNRLLMCLAIPAKIVSLDGTSARVDFGGVQRDVDVSLVEVKVGSYVIVHAGFAIQILDQEEALRTRELFSQLLEDYSPPAESL